MPNPLTSALLPPQKNSAPEVARPDETELTAGVGFLDILNMISSGAPSDPQLLEAETPMPTSENPEEFAEPEAHSDPVLSDAHPPTQHSERAPDASETKVPISTLKSEPETIGADGDLQPEQPVSPYVQTPISTDEQSRYIGQGDQKIDPQQRPQAPIAETIQKAAILRVQEGNPKPKASNDRSGELSVASVPLASSDQTTAMNTDRQTTPQNAVMVRMSVPEPEPQGKSDELPLDPKTDAIGASRESGLPSNARDILSTSSAAGARTEIARAIAGQMAAAITTKPGSGHIEIALNPEELGRVSITMGGRDDGLHLLIAAERPETLDLMRRHISVLASEFQKLGYSDLSFDLNFTGGGNHDADESSASSPFEAIEPDDAAETAPQPTQTSPDRGLDMRL